MNYYELLYNAADASGIPTTRIGEQLGKGREYVSRGRSRGSSPSVDNAAAMLAVCGYSLAAIPHGAPLPDGALVLDAPAAASPAAQAERKRKEADAAERKAARLRAEAEQLTQQ